MLFFSKTKKPSTLPFFRDLHAHLLPGIDDGPDTMEESLELIRGFSRMGLTSLTATPHVYQEFYPNTKDKILDAYIALHSEMKKTGLDIELEIGAEYYLDDHFARQLKEGTVLPIAGGFLLVETSFVAAPPKLHQYIFQIQTHGYKPLLAHPERYIYMTMDDYEDLLDQGCQFQANLLSFGGYYGRQIKKNAFRLLKNGWLHAIGSDVHNKTQLLILKKLLSAPKVSKLAEYQWLNEFI